MITPKNPLFVLAGNGSYANKGCEAIVRGTVEIVRQYFDNPRFHVVSNFHSHEQYEEQCKNEQDDSITHISTKRIKRFNLAWWLRQVNNRVLHSKIIEHYPFLDMDESVKNALAVLSVGGDNYSLYYYVPDSFVAMDDFVMKRNKPIIIWGASIGPFDKNPEFEKKIIPHLRLVNGILVRESVTFEYLSEKNVIQNVYNVADPAVIMDPIKPVGIKMVFDIKSDAIGINLSPLMAKYVCDGKLDVWRKIATDVVRSILNNVDGQVVLVPHVTEVNNDDYEFLKEIKENLKNQNKSVLILPPNLSAAETKWVISKMNVFIGARTHSTIAALSSCIPTISLSYSIKALGINRQFYGHTKYCINPDEITADYVTSVVLKLIKNNDKERSVLREVNPKIKKMAFNSGLILRDILKDY